MKKTLYILVIGILLISCGGGLGSSEQNLAHLYQDGGLGIQPSIQVAHEKIDSSLIRIQLDRNQLLYIREADQDTFRSEVRVSYSLYSNYQNMLLLDSGSTSIIDRKLSTETGFIQSSVGFLRPEGLTEAFLRLNIKDIQRNFDLSFDYPIRNQDLQDQQYFELSELDGKLLFQPWVKSGESYRVNYLLDENTKLFVRYYDREFPIAIPPYAENKNEPFLFKEDSLFIVSSSDTLQFQKTGIYHFQLDTASTSGFSLFNFGSSFPYVSEIEQLAPPMRYLTTRGEHEEMIETNSRDSLKLLADRFWIRSAGSEERAQNVLQEFYGRVENSNERFTSYIEGWKTDRGIIYTIYGPPSQVFRSDEGESWVYGDRNSDLNYAFNFYKINNPFSNNDYALARYTYYRYGWGQAVGAWRNGRSYGVKDIKREQDARDAQNRQQRQSPAFWY